MSSFLINKSVTYYYFLFKITTISENFNILVICIRTLASEPVFVVCTKSYPELSYVGIEPATRQSGDMAW